MELTNVALAILVGAVVSTAWPGTASAEESAEPLTVAEQAVAHCRPTVDHAAEFFDDLPIDEDEVVQCEVWTVLNATQVDLDVLACLAGAGDAQVWVACLPDDEPTVPWRRELAATLSENRYGILDEDRAELDRQIAENAGVLGALADSSELDGIFGSSGLDADLVGGIGGLIGAKGTQIGSGGLGSRGSGLGGGGTAEGLGGLGTRGRGSGTGYGSGDGNFGDGSGEGVTTVGGDPIILGALSKEAIDGVIRRHVNQLRYCYQRELTKDPNIAGKVVVKFTIAADGSVSAASIKSTTMNNESVESCVSGRFMRMVFPEPRGGGIVIVSYPLIFTNGS